MISVDDATLPQLYYDHRKHKDILMKIVNKSTLTSHLLHTMYRDIKDTTVGTLSQRITNQVHGLKGLNSKLLDIRAYLERVVAGKLPINHQIIYQLQDVFNLLPDVNLLVSYLCLQCIYSFIYLFIVIWLWELDSYNELKLYFLQLLDNFALMQWTKETWIGKQKM